MSVIIFIIILLVLVLVHEFGHFFSAKRFGIRVDEFGFGFPPKLFGKKYGETEYSLNLLPIGGFVRIYGENYEELEKSEKDGEEKKEDPDYERSFIAKSKWKQAIVLLSGVLANFILAWLLFSIGFMWGLPTSLGTEPEGYKVANPHLVVVSVLSNSPAEKAGLKPGDKIVYTETQGVSTTYVSPETIKSIVTTGNEIKVGYLRGKDTTENFTEIVPENKDGKFAIGIAMDQIGTLKLPFLKALWEGLVLDSTLTKDTAIGLWGLLKGAFSGQGSLSSVTGPVGLIGIVGSAYQFGFSYLLSFTALISINLAIINLIPFPALDGGRLLFLLIEKIKGSRLNPKFANTANMVGFFILILLMILVTFHDVTKMF